jgi:hypothetical protein
MRRVLILLTVLGGLLGSLATGTSAGAVTAAPPEVAQLVAVRAAHHPGFDRVVFEFDGPLPGTRLARYVPTLYADGSGEPVRIAGRAILAITMFQANAHDVDTGQVTAPRRLAFALPNVMNVVQSGDFEATVSYGIGLAARQPFRVFTLRNPSRVVVDIDANFPTVLRRVYFLDEPRFVAGRPPYVRYVLRPVRPLTPVTDLLHRLFAGPTAREHADGLRLIRSGATTFSNVSVRDEVARLRLRGGCSSGGSTFTIANEIFPTLKRLEAVDYVKIYDPSGNTEQPTGRRDSIPECLEP